MISASYDNSDKNVKIDVLTMINKKKNTIAKVDVYRNTIIIWKEKVIFDDISQRKVVSYQTVNNESIHFTIHNINYSKQSCLYF